MSELKDKEEDLDEISNENENNWNIGWEQKGNVEHYQKTRFSNF